MSDRSNPQCPSCGSIIDQMYLRKSFIFVDGIRYVAEMSWVPDCCEAIIVDEDFGFDTVEIHDEDHGSLLLATLRDDNGAEIMKWWDELPDECVCDVDDDDCY